MDQAFATSAPPPPASPSRLSRLGKYRMIADLGHGGMSEVYLAVSQGMAGFQKLRVIKLLRQDLGRDPQFVRMFLDEARLAARLSHSHVVQTNEVGEIDGRYFIDMEYIEGQSLSTIMKRVWRNGQRIPAPLAARIAADALAGLHYAHEFLDFDGTPLHIVHRDVSPHNMLVRYDGVVIVVDFGIAKASTRSTATETGVIKGKVAYMAPEQAMGSQSADARVDVFAIGVVLHEQLTGKRFWPKMADMEILHALYRSELPPSPRAIDPSVPEELDAIVRKATAAQAADRYASAAEMIRDLEAYLESSGAKASHRDVADYVAGLFAEDRKRLRAVIDAQLKAIEAGGSSSLLELSSTITADFGMSRSGSHTGTPSGSIKISGQETKSGDHPALPAPYPESKGRVSLAGMGALVVALAVGGVLLVHRLTPSAPAAVAAAPPPVLPPATTTAPSAPAAVSPGRPNIRVLVAAEPHDARLYLDDAELPRNPYLTAVAADASVHRLRAEAPGYAARTVVVTFNADVELELRLEKLAEPHRPQRARGKEPSSVREAAAPSATAAPPASAAKPAETTSRPKPTAIDETNPFR